MKKIASITGLLLSILLLAGSAHAQSASDIIDRMLQMHTDALANIETMMVVTEMEGFMSTDEPDTTYYRKVEMDNGMSTLEPVTSVTDRPSSDSYNFAKNYQTIVDNASYEGTESINGRTAHVLFIEDVSAFYDDVVATVPEEQEPQSGYLYIDSDDYVLLRMRFNINFDGEFDGGIEINMSDFRDVDGLKMPFKTEMKVEGISDEFDPEDLAEARKNLQELREQLDNASGMERRIMERAVLPQIERFEEMLEEGGLTMISTTLAAETNVTIPD